MNDSEAGAQKLLESFKSSNEVVRFFVAALNDQRDLESFTGKLESYAQLAARRAELEALAPTLAYAAERRGRRPPAVPRAPAFAMAYPPSKRTSAPHEPRRTRHRALWDAG